jgi:hypothetical protein
MHTQTDTARIILGHGADCVMTVKADMPTLHRQLKKLPWAAIPVVSAVSTGHGRRARRIIKVALAPAWIEFDGAAQVRNCAARSLTRQRELTRQHTLVLGFTRTSDTQLPRYFSASRRAAVASPSGRSGGTAVSSRSARSSPWWRCRRRVVHIRESDAEVGQRSVKICCRGWPAKWPCRARRDGRRAGRYPCAGGRTC